MKDCVTLQEINDLRIFGNTILTYKSVEDVVKYTFLKIKEKIFPQVISIFLFSKEGCIERFKIYGIDKYEKIISDSWLSKESYEPGISFSGRAAYGKPYGETHWSNSLNQELDQLTHGQDYVDKLGFLRCGISVPLNGTRRTFGTLEVINRVDSETRKANSNLVFSDSDICWLTIVGAHVAAAISRLRKKDEDKIFATISRVLADPSLEQQPVHSMNQSVYKVIAEKLVDHLMPYKVCIVRLTFDGRSLIVTDKANSDEKKGWIGRHDEPRLLGEGIVGKVFESGNLVAISNIKEREKEFSSLSWIKRQGLKSFICFPLLMLGKVIGTLSLFTGYVHEFTDSDIEFLENVSFLLAAFKVRSEKIKNIEVPAPSIVSTGSLKNSFKLEQADSRNIIFNDLSSDYNDYFDNTLLLSFETASKLYQQYLDSGNYIEASKSANSVYEMCQKLIESVHKNENEELYRKLIALSSYWKLNRDLYSVRGSLDGDE
ncbi:MAG: GAF domain-containing protein [Cyanobacteria bacterium SBC]|nr:GAF domain-containing protein [Cyanobacteria bacterium SBC]